MADSVMSLVVRARGRAAAVTPDVRDAIWSIDKDQPIARVSLLEDLVAASAGERRLAAVLFQAFALAALILAGAGIYGVLSGYVAERTREIGVRVALGASPEKIFRLVFGEGLGLTAAGGLIGAAGAAVTTNVIASLLFGVSRLDPLTYAGAAALLAVVAAVACGVPAWGALRIDPATTLRAE